MKSLNKRTERPAINLPSGIKNKSHNPTAPMSSLPFRKNPQELNYRLKNYLKIVTVRHPLIRFVSAYRDKFIEHVGRFRKDIPKAIIANRGPDFSGPARPVTFLEFANFVTLPKNNSRVYASVKTINPHWIPLHKRSRPCAHDFDIIAKLETSDEDLAYIKALVGVSETTFLAEYTNRHVVTNNETLTVTYYQQLTEEAFQRVVNFFDLDFDLFGYYKPKTIAEVELIFKDFA